MKPPPNREVALFSAALELPANQRSAYLDGACADDPALRLRLEALLRVHDEAIPFLESPPPGAQASPVGAEPPGATARLSGSPAERAGDRIGRYKLLQQIGEGGCGVVYMAEQEEPVRRRVALKVIKLGMDTKQVIARFEAERQALALMDHPNIAKVLDAGATETGRPYFVMELVRGIKITDYCDENTLSTNERLELFIQVCHAVQHAHQKGIIHRDLKPSNILVASNDGVPVPKVIDFGIAKATQGRLTDQTLFTAFEQFIGTPAYMSPEQAELTMQDVDTRTDIYSLGVLLYELLTSRTPFDAQELLASGLDAMRRTIREQEPQRPSTRLNTMVANELTTTARHRRIEAVKLIHLLRGDLDWIVMKCLEKDRARRYDTANGLANDVKRHLSCEPVVARPPSRLYEFQKTVRRHRFGFAAAAALILVLAAGVVVSTAEAIRAKRAEREQSRLFQEAERAGRQAKAQGQLAEKSANDARQEQRRASEQELLARWRFYAAQINLANQAVESGQLGQAYEWLETQRPKSAAEDLRTFEWYYLWGVCNGRLRQTLPAHAAPVNAVAISADGKTLASASRDGSIRLWETSTGQQRIRMDLSPSNPVYAVAFTPDGKTVAGGYWDGMVRLWDISSASVRAAWRGQRGWVRTLAITRDGRSLACGGDDGVIRLFDLASGTEQASLAGYGMVLALDFSRDGGRLASAYGWATNGTTVKVWNVGPGQTRPGIEVANSVVLGLAFSPDGKMLATASGEILVWDTAAGQLESTLRGQPPPIHSLVWLSNGKALASCASDRTIRLWPMPPTNNVVSDSQTVGEHLDSILCLANSADGTLLVSGANDGSVKLWNMALTRQEVEAQAASHFQIETMSTDSRPVTVCFSPDGSELFVTAAENTVVRNLVSGKEVRTVTGAGGRAVLSPDGKLLATGDQEGNLHLWEQASGRLLGVTKAHSNEVTAVAFSPDGKLLATCGFGDPDVKAWDPAAALKPLWQTYAHCASVTALTFSPDGQTIAAIEQHVGVGFFDASTGRRHEGFPVERGYSEIRVLAWSPDGEVLATGSETGSVKLWDMETGRLLVALSGHTAYIRSISFSPDGRTVASSSEDESVRLWDVATGQQRLTWRGFHSWVTSVSFSRDGKALAAGSTDGRIQVWRASQHPEALSPADHAEVVGALHLLAIRRMKVVLPDATLGRAKWKYTFERPPDDWFKPAFNAVAWKEGLGGFGTAGTPGSFPNTTWDTSDIWLRSEFTLGSEELSGLRLHVFHDEDASIYLNGVLALQLKGFVTEYEEFEIPPVAEAALRQGTNTIAVQCHQTTGGQGIDVGVLEKASPSSARDLGSARFLVSLGKFAEARQAYSDAIRLKPEMAEAWAGRGNCHLNLGEFMKMAEDYSEAIRLEPGRQWYWHERADAYMELGEYRKAIADHTKAIGLDDHDADQRARRAHCHEVLGELRQAEADYSRAIELDPAGWQNWHARARLYSLEHQLDKARNDLAEAMNRCVHGKLDDQNALAWALATGEDPALRDGSNAVRLAETACAATGRTNASYLDTLAAADAEAGRFDKAVSVQNEAMALLRNEQERKDYASRLGLYEAKIPYHDDFALASRATDLLASGKSSEAEPLVRECLVLREKQIPDDWRTFNARSMLGGSLLGQQKYADAEPLLLSGYEGMKQRENRIPPEGRPRLKEALQRVVTLYEQTSRPDQAAEWKRKQAELDKTEK